MYKLGVSRIICKIQIFRMIYFFIPYLGYEFTSYWVWQDIWV